MRPTTGALYHYGLISRHENGFRVHRLVQTVTRDHLNRRETRAWAERAAALVLRALPDTPSDPQHWPTIAQLLPHALAITDYTEYVVPDRIRKLLNAIGVYFGSRAWNREQLHEARSYLSQALGLAESADGPDYPNVADILNNLGAVLCMLNETSAAREALERVVHILENTDGWDAFQFAGALRNLGQIHRNQGDLKGAQSLIERAVSILETAYGPDATQVAGALVSLGTVLCMSGQHSRARTLLERAINIGEAEYEPNYLEIARARVVLGAVLHNQRNLRAAQRQFEYALKTFETIYGPDHLQVASISFTLGIVLIQLGQLRTGLHLVRKSSLVRPVASMVRHRGANGLTLLDRAS